MHPDKLFRFDVYKLAQDCLDKYFDAMGWTRADDVIINIQDIYENVIYPDYEVKLITCVDLGCVNGYKVLGKTLIADDEILIDPSIADDVNSPEYAFTLAHEIGHILFHNKRDQDITSKEDSIFDEGFLNEFHADSFAELLLMPHRFLIYRYIKLHGSWHAFTYNGPGNYLITNSCVEISSLQHLYQKVTESLAPYFPNVLPACLASNIQRLRPIEDKTVVMPESKIIKSTPLIEGSPLFKLNQELCSHRFKS